MYYNSKRLASPRLREGNLIYILRRNIQIIRPSDKLDHKKIGLFRIKRNIRDINYELYLPPTMRIHSIFYVSLLKLADSNTPIGPAPEIHSDS